MSKQVLIKNQLNANAEKHGYWEEYYENDNLCSIGYYNNGKHHGCWKRYWYNGNLCYIGNFVNDKRSGYWETYHYFVNDLLTKKYYL
jgi:antitoxin component YwqK of YwqJK toxin-antitoxin module